MDMRTLATIFIFGVIVANVGNANGHTGEKHMAQKKKRNPADSTLRNVRAANKRIAELESHVSELMVRLEVVETTIVTITAWVQVQPKASPEVSE